MADQTASGETKLTKNTFTDPGHVFVGWMSSLGGMYADEALYTFGKIELNPLGENATLYARFEPSPSVTFDGNGGVHPRRFSGVVSAVQYGVGTADLDANPFTRSDYTFAGWATTPTGSVAYANRASYPFAGNVTLYAQWSRDGSVTFNGNGATSGRMFSIGGNGPARLLRNDFTRTGCSFAGWATTPTGSVAYTDGAEYPFNEGPVTLYAKWGCTATNYFIANDGSGQRGGVSCSNACTLPTIAQLGFGGTTATGYSFVGWATTPTGSVMYNDGASFVPDGGGSTTLYAKWGCIPLNVTASAKRIGANRAEVTFTAPKSESPWTSFAAYAAKEGGKGATVNTSLTTGTILVNGLDKNSGYTFDVTATNAAGCSYKATANRVLKW
jgi:uncharacterized repeat protein (TIGR02543 family)